MKVIEFLLESFIAINEKIGSHEAGVREAVDNTRDNFRKRLPRHFPFT